MRRKDAIEQELVARVIALRAQAFADLARLPEASSGDVIVLGKPIRFSVFRSREPDGGLLILVRTDRALVLGLGSTGRTEGFHVLPSGVTRDARAGEIMDFFG